MAAETAIKLFLAATASGTPIECPPPSTSDTVGFFHARDQLSDGKSGLHIAADRVEQNQQTVDFVGLLNCRNLRDEVLVLGGFVLCGKFHVALDLADNGDAVYRSARCSCRNRAGFRDGILFRCGNRRGFFGHR